MKFLIKTYGCQMNARDSEALAAILIERGYTPATREEEADLLVFNTCSVRDQAERKAIGKIGYMKKLKSAKPELVIGCIGCMAQNRGDELFRLLPHLDFVLGTNQLHKLPEAVEAIRSGHGRRSELSEDPHEILSALKGHLPGEIFGSIAITRGCNRFCSYCIVPYVRGREVSRSEDDILAEAEAMAKSGCREILLLGQNVAAYGLGGDVRPPAEDHSPFAGLMEKICRIDGIARVRFTSPYVSYFNARLIDTLAAEPKICRSYHLPVQSGSDRILKRMNRQYTAASYLEKVRLIRSRIPDCTFSTDVIVGFPGETEEDFKATRDLLNEVGFDHSFIFKYSPRQGTKAAEMPDQIPPEVKEERNAILLDDLEKRVAAKLKSAVGSLQQVMAEGVSRRNEKRWSGKTGTARTVVFEPDGGELRPGMLLDIRITRANSVSLFGKIER